MPRHQESLSSTPDAQPSIRLEIDVPTDAEAQRLVRESEERYRALVSVLAQIVWTANADGQVERDIPSWCAFTGQSADEVRGWGWLEAIHPDDRAETERIWTQAVEARSIYTTAYRLRRADGVYRYFNVRAAPVLAADGTVREWVGACADVTECEAMEQRLRAATREAQARSNESAAIFEAAVDAIFVFDREGALLRANRAVQDLLTPEGYAAYARLMPRERMESGMVRDERGNLLAPERSPLLRMLRGESITSKDGLDLILHLPQNHCVQVNITGGPVRDATGELTHVVMLARDVTARRQLEHRTTAALNALLAMAETLVSTDDTTTDDTATDDASTSEQEAARSSTAVAHRLVELTCSVLGCERVSITAIEPETDILRPVAQIGLTPEQERQWLDDISLNEIPLRSQMEPASVERLYAGEAIIYDLTQPPYNQVPNPYAIRVMLVAPMRIGDRLVGLLALDHGKQTHAFTEDEIALANAVAQLAALVLERERLLRSRAQASAQALALAEANRQMDVFLGIVSHELRNPLTSIKANIQLAQRRLHRLARSEQGTSSAPALAQQVAAVTNLLERADRQIGLQDRLVSDLLDVSRIQADRLELRLMPCDLAVIVRDVVEEQRLATPGRQITLELPSKRRAVPVVADADRIRQVIGNYLTNAIKYAPAEKPVLVRLEARKGMARVGVRDEGPGLPPEEQELIWRRFHRAKHIADLSKSGASLGLGLHISKMLIQRHGGDVGVESAVGQGSTFWFTLPLANGKA